MNGLVLTITFAAIFFYILHGVVRAAVRDGILQAEERRREAAGVPDAGTARN